MSTWILILTLVFEGAAIHTVEFKFKDDCIKAKQSYEQMFTKQKVYRPTVEAICVEKRTIDQAKEEERKAKWGF